MRSLGRIEGKQDAMDQQQKAQDAKLDAIDERLRNMEITSAKRAAISGGVVSILVLTIKSLVFGSYSGGA